jgi:2-dehydropantoate 2-reductase
MRVLIYGSGVIGQIYGGRLAQAGHDVTLLARGPAVEALAARGVTLRRDGEVSHARPRVAARIADGDRFDVILVTVRLDQLAEVLPVLAVTSADRIALMLNQSVDLDGIRDQVGRARTIFTFPGVGGQHTDDGAISYLEIAQQHTTVERRDGIEAPVVELLRSAGFVLDIRDSIGDWLKTHAVFITAVGAAIIDSGGDSAALAADRSRVANLVQAVREGFRALARQGVAVTPAPLRVIFTVVPRFIAVRYWQRQLKGPLGSVAIAPHVRATRDTEFPLISADVRRLVAGHGPTPHLDRLLGIREETT